MCDVNNTKFPEEPPTDLLLKAAMRRKINNIKGTSQKVASQNISESLSLKVEKTSSWPRCVELLVEKKGKRVPQEILLETTSTGRRVVRKRLTITTARHRECLAKMSKVDLSKVAKKTNFNVRAVSISQRVRAAWDGR